MVPIYSFKKIDVKKLSDRVHIKISNIQNFAGVFPKVDAIKQFYVLQLP